LALGAAWTAALKRRNDLPELAFGLTWLCVGLLPTSNLVPLPLTLAEHWLYIPSLGLYWIVAAALSRWVPLEGWGRGRPATLALAVVLGLFTWRTRDRVREWKDGMTLYTADLRYAPNSFLLHNNLGVELFRQGRYDEAGAEFEAAARIEPRYGTTINNLGAMLERKGEDMEAEDAYRRAIASSEYELAYVNLAKLLLRTGRTTEAKDLLLDARRRYPFNDEIEALLRAIPAL
jgi:tetratricopeptide (TPR) repeat protein